MDDKLKAEILDKALQVFAPLEFNDQVGLFLGLKAQLLNQRRDAISGREADIKSISESIEALQQGNEAILGTPSINFSGPDNHIHSSDKFA